jgi:hypothetical protein
VRVCQQVSKKKAQTHLGRAQGGSPQDEEDFGIFEFDSEHARGVFLSEWAASKERGATLMADCGGCSTRNALGQCARADGVAGGGFVRRSHEVHRGAVPRRRARELHGSHIFFGFEFTTKQMAEAVSKLHLSINKDSSDETIKRLVGFSPRVCIPLSGVAFVCFHRVCDFCRAARLPLVETSSCHGVTRRFWSSALTAMLSWARRMSWE